MMMVVMVVRGGLLLSRLWAIQCTRPSCPRRMEREELQAKTFGESDSFGEVVVFRRCRCPWRRWC